jgi:hypothetical protein
MANDQLHRSNLAGSDIGHRLLAIGHSRSEVAPEVGFEPTTNRLTADRSTTELLRILRGAKSYRQYAPVQVKCFPEQSDREGWKPTERYTSTGSEWRSYR